MLKFLSNKLTFQDFAKYFSFDSIHSQTNIDYIYYIVFGTFVITSYTKITFYSRIIFSNQSQDKNKHWIDLVDYNNMYLKN